MEAVVGSAVAEKFCVDFSISFFCVLVFFEDEDARTFAEDKAVPVLVEGSGGSLGIVVAGAERFSGTEGGKAQGREGSLGAACNHNITSACEDIVIGLADRVAAGGTGAGYRHIRATQAEINGDTAAGSITHKSRDTEWGDLSWAFFEESYVLVLDFLYAADAGANDDAAAVRVFSGKIEGAVLDGLNGGSNGQFSKAVHPVSLSPVNVFSDVKVFDFSAESDGELARIEVFYERDAAFAVAKRGKKQFSRLCQGGDAAQTCDNDSSFSHFSFFRLF